MKLTDDFIIGLVVGEGTFCLTTIGSKLPGDYKKIPAFQLKMHV